MGVERRDVVVIGAGPAGSAAARAAALAGLSPLLVEKDEAPGATNACGGFAGYAFRSALGLPDSVVERELRRTLLVIDGKPRVYGGRHPHYISFRRQPFDTFLAHRAVEAGAELRTSVRASVLDAASRRLALEDLHGGAVCEVQARIIVFADGPATMAPDAFGIGHRPTRRTRTAIFVELDGEYGDGETAEIHVNTAYTKSYIWLFPKRECVWVGVGRPLLRTGPPLRQRLEAFIEQHPDLRGRNVRKAGGGMVPSDPAKELVADGAMAVGDAAGLVNPMTGGGIAFALLSGQLAGQVAAESLHARRSGRDALRAYPARLRRTPHYWWLMAMKWWRRRLDGLDPSRQPAAYASMLRKYLAFFHWARVLADFVLGSPHRGK